MLTQGAAASLPGLPHLLHQRLGRPWALAPPRTKSLPVQGDGISRVAHLPPETGHVGLLAWACGLPPGPGRPGTTTATSKAAHIRLQHPQTGHGATMVALRLG